jgi:hypothetical protein
MIIGILGMSLGPFLGGDFFGAFGTMFETASNPDANAAQFCNDGETLDVVQGPSTRSGTGSTATTGRTTIYYCVDASGERRDVTGQAVGELLTGANGIFTNLSSFLPFRLEFVGAFVVGLIMTIIGGTMMRRSMIKRLLESGGVASVQWDVNDMSPRVVVSQRSQAIRHDSAQSLIDQINQAAKRSTQQVTGDDLTVRLEQVEQAYQKRLISQEEYDRLRKEILDSLA